MMKRVYICSPLAGNFPVNVEKAKKYCRETAVCGALPLAPHVYFTQFLDDANSAEREIGMRMGLELLKLCDELHVYGDVISSGMAQEIVFAKNLGLPVFYMKGLE